MIQVIVKNSKTGSQYICKSASKTVKDIAYKHISYCFICRHKDAKNNQNVPRYTRID